MSNAEIKSIAAMLASFQAAWQDRDIERWGSFFTPDADFITWRGAWWASREENIAGHKSFPRTIRDQMPNYVLTVEKIELLAPAVALVHACWRWPAFVEDEAAPEDRQGILTMVIVNLDGQWRIRAVQNTRVPL
jgi:uncharacterized protein (TIGR02246 family)